MASYHRTSTNIAQKTLYDYHIYDVYDCSDVYTCIKYLTLKPSSKFKFNLFELYVIYYFYIESTTTMYMCMFASCIFTNKTRQQSIQIHKGILKVHVRVKFILSFNIVFNLEIVLQRLLIRRECVGGNDFARRLFK